MRITDLKAVYPNYRRVPPSWRTHLWQIVVRVDTDTGYYGYGYGGGGQASLPIVNGHFRELIAGRELNSVEDIRSIWDHLYAESIPYGRRGVAIMALSGVDLALWDALARAESLPVAALVSNDRKGAIRCYATGPDVEYHAELGFTGSKRPHRWTGDAAAAVDDLSAWAERARGLLGPEALLMVDTYMSWDADAAVQMANALALYDFRWFEDVLTPDDLEGQARLRTAIGNVNLAGGEHEFTEHGFAGIAHAGALDIWQPDITWCGGITSGLRIVELAQRYGIPVVPHRGGEVWGLHLIAATACEDLAEVVTGPRNAEIDVIWRGAPSPVDGLIEISDAPGFGVEPLIPV